MAMLWPLLHLRLACSPYAHRSQKITTQWLYLEQRRQQKHGTLTKLSQPTQLLTDQEWYEFDITNQNVHSLQQRHGKAQSLVRWWAPFYLLVRKECLSYVQWYYSTVEFHSSTNCTNHAPFYLTSTIRYGPTATGHGAAFSVVWGASKRAQGWALGAPSRTRSPPAFRSAFGASPARHGGMRRSL
jgi:hypothetical protein